MKDSAYIERLQAAKSTEAELPRRFITEFNRLLHSGAIDDDTSAALIIGVALENIADAYLRAVKFSEKGRGGARSHSAYRNLKSF